jgi:hypothetical protein
MSENQFTIDQGIKDLEKYANLSSPSATERSIQQFEYRAYNHAGLDHESPLADTVLEEVGRRTGGQVEAASLVDLQQIVHFEIEDMHDIPSNIPEELLEQNRKMIKNYEVVENAVLNLLTEKRLKSNERFAVRTYLSHHIDRWSEREKKAEPESKDALTARQNQAIFGSLYEKFQEKDIKNQEAHEIPTKAAHQSRNRHHAPQTAG